MIEATDILAYCDHFERYLPPLDIAVLRLHYKGYEQQANRFLRYKVGDQKGCRK